MSTSFWPPRNACSKTELALFAERPVQTDIESSHYTKIYPLNNVSNSSGPIEFFIQGSADDYIDLDETKLCTRVKVVKANGDALTAAETHIFPVNNWAHSIISDITCHLNETQIEGGIHMYAYKAYLTNLLLYGKETKAQQLRTSGWVKDQATKMNDPTNPGFTTRKSWIAQSRSHDLIAPLHLDICHQGKLILSQVDVRLKMTRNKDTFHLISQKDGDKEAVEVKLVIEEAFLLVRRVQVAADTIRQHETGLQLQNAKYPFQRTEMHTYTIAQGSQSHVKENLFHGQMPKLLILGMVNNEDFNGKSDTNPFCFKHFNVNHVGVYKDGMPIPHVAFTPNFSSNLYSLEYTALMSALDLATSEGDIDLTLNDYGNGYTLFAFNLSPDKCVSGHGQPLQDGNLRIELKFASPLAKAINVITMAIFDDQLEISRLRKVTLTNS